MDSFRSAVYSVQFSSNAKGFGLSLSNLPYITATMYITAILYIVLRGSRETLRLYEKKYIKKTSAGVRAYTEPRINANECRNLYVYKIFNRTATAASEIFMIMFGGIQL